MNLFKITYFALYKYYRNGSTPSSGKLSAVVFVSILFMILVLDIFAVFRITGFVSKGTGFPKIFEKRLVWFLLGFPIYYILSKLFPTLKVSEEVELSNKQMKTGLSIAFGLAIFLCIALFFLILEYNKTLK